jgi:hypothetical protein
LEEAMEELKAAIAEHKKEIENLAAETMALQFILSAVLQNLIVANPDLASIILKSFDNAANAAEGLSMAFEKDSGHMPKTLKVIEELRTTIKGKDKPRSGI